MPQLALFDAGPRTLVDDDSGRISYAPALLDEATAAAWFATLRDDVAWKSERRMMYDREVDVPRLLASFRLEEVRAATRSAPLERVRAVLRAASDVVAAHVGVAFDSVGLNFYRDGRDSVAPHNDHLDELAPGAPIALLSLGSARRMTIRAKEKPPRVLHLELEPGSVLVMSYATQLNYDHGIPKTDEAVGPRISLAFRVRPAAHGTTARY
jgi:alkylated DNA repair dioxygenase AlkB